MASNPMALRSASANRAGFGPPLGLARLALERAAQHVEVVRQREVVPRAALNRRRRQPVIRRRADQVDRRSRGGSSARRSMAALSAPPASSSSTDAPAGGGRAPRRGATITTPARSSRASSARLARKLSESSTRAMSQGCSLTPRSARDQVMQRTVVGSAVMVVGPIVVLVLEGVQRAADVALAPALSLACPASAVAGSTSVPAPSRNQRSRSTNRVRSVAADVGGDQRRVELDLFLGVEVAHVGERLSVERAVDLAR